MSVQGQVSLSNVISVSLLATTSQLQERNVNNIAIFTNDTPGFVDEVKIYRNALETPTDFGSTTLTHKIVNNIFSQNPNPLTGDGYVAVVPLLSAVSATQGDFVTTDISANLAAFLLISDGEFAITLNGTASDITGLDFTNASTLAEVAAVIQRKLTNVFVTASSTAITFTSKQFGTSSAITFAAVGGGVGTDLTGASYLNTSAGTASSGTASTGETIEDAITRVKDKIDFTGVYDTLNLEGTVRTTTATDLASQDRIFYIATATTEDFTGIATTIKNASQTKARVLYYSESIEDSKLMTAAAIGRNHSVNFNGVNTLHTMHLKKLINITPDEIMNETIYTAAETAGVDLYTSFGGLIGYASFGANEFIDNVLSDLWLKSAVQVGGANYLASTNTKIPQTEEGMEGYKNAIEKVLQRAVRVAMLGTGNAWNSAIPFGDPATLLRNIKNAGYYIYSLPIVQQSQTAREAREAPVVQIAAKRAGAIHSSDIIINVEA
jgi:hypothetical protein